MDKQELRQSERGRGFKLYFDLAVGKMVAVGNKAVQARQT